MVKQPINTIDLFSTKKLLKKSKILTKIKKGTKNKKEINSLLSLKPYRLFNKNLNIRSTFF